jgi:hypothetical protein
VSVLEQNAAKFLYRFGIKPPAGDRTRPEVIFTSVYYGRSLTEVMDTTGRGKVQELVCSEISVRPLDRVNSEAPLMIKSINEKAKAYFEGYGITLDYLGWGGTFTFDADVQAAINRVYIAQKDEEVAKRLAPYTETIKALAAAELLRSFGTKTDGKLPTTFVGVPHDLGDFVSKLLQAPPLPPVAK